jgi:predicted O-methyltransferase YrrM
MMFKQIVLSIPAVKRLHQQRGVLQAERKVLLSEKEQMLRTIRQLELEKSELEQKFSELELEYTDLAVERELGWPQAQQSQESVVQLGRNVTEGYLRGWGLEFGPLRKSVLQSPMFREAVNVVQGRTICTLEKMANLYLLIRYYLPQVDRGNIVEFGSYRGGTAIFMAFLAKKLKRPYKIIGLDTFAGMPKTDPMKDLHEEGDFSDVDLAEIKRSTEALGLDNLEFVPGLFEDTFPQVARREAPFCMAHIDCDIFDSLLYSYNAVKPLMAPGGYIVFDDPLYGSCLGAFQAVEQEVIRKDNLSAEQVYPHLVYRYPPLRA